MAGKRDEVTIAEVAEALNISKTTVSRAISGKGRVSEATRARVFIISARAARMQLRRCALRSRAQPTTLRW